MAGICSPCTPSIMGHLSQQCWRSCSCLEPSHSSPRPCSQVLTEAALSPVVVGQAVVALGPRGTFLALTVAGLVAAVVHGADLVAVTFWPKTGGSVPVLPGSLCVQFPEEGAGDFGKVGRCAVEHSLETKGLGGCGGLRGPDSANGHGCKGHSSLELSLSWLSKAPESSQKDILL